LPHPPTPVSVTNGELPIKRSISAISRWRPIKGVNARGRGVSLRRSLRRLPTTSWVGLTPTWDWPGSELDARLVRAAELQRADQPLRSVAVRMRRPTLQLLDAVHTQARLLGQAPLRQSHRKSMLPQQRTKPGGCSARLNRFSADHDRVAG
jgi:hypothetical protein